eukprot:5824277-Alexandrium_andersonii.AAC.1
MCIRDSPLLVDLPSLRPGSRLPDLIGRRHAQSREGVGWPARSWSEQGARAPGYGRIPWDQRCQSAVP